MLHNLGVSLLKIVPGYAHTVIRGLELVHLAEFLIIFRDSHVVMLAVAMFSSPQVAAALTVITVALLGRTWHQKALRAHGKAAPATPPRNDQTFSNEHIRVTIGQRHTRLPDGSECMEQVVEYEKRSGESRTAGPARALHDRRPRRRRARRDRE